MKYDNGFECDRKAKNKLKHLIKDIWFSAFTIAIDEINDNNDKAYIDVIFTATSKNNKQYKYAIELKERKGYNHNFKIKDKTVDWMLEKEKYNKLYNAQYLSGYTSVYYNEFKDDVYALWTLDDIDKCKYEQSLYATKTTQGNDTTKYDKKPYLLPFNKATLTGYTYEDK